MMAKLKYLTLLLLPLLGAVLEESGAEVIIPFPVDSLLQSSGLNSLCTVKNESFIGWFKVNGNVKIEVVPNRNAVRDKPGVVVQTLNPNEKNALLIMPLGSPPSAGGRYKCKGDKNEEILEVQVTFELDSLQKNQTLPLGHTGAVILGALSYPLSKFKWKKDGAVIDFAANPRLTMENDGSISISKVRLSDAGTYDVSINWLNRRFVDESISVLVAYDQVKGKPTSLGPTWKQPANISNTTPPIISPLKNKTVTKGDPILLLCNATGTPTPNVSWSKADGKINPAYVTGNVLRIPRAKLTDAGKYICTAKNKLFTKTVEAFVTVNLRPRSPSSLSTQIIPLSIKVYWKKPESHGYPVLMYSVHKVQLDQAGNEVTSHTYHVNEDVHQYEVGDIKDGKTYKFYVTAWNTHGESMKDPSKSATVKVQKP